MKKSIYTIFFLLILAATNLNAQVSTSSFLQTVKTEITLPPEAGKNVIKLFSANQSVIAVTKNGVFRYRNGNWSGKSNGSDWRTATMDKQGKVWLCSVNYIQQENSDEKLTLPELSKNDTILCLFWEGEKTLHVGTTGGLLTWNGKWNILPEIKARVNAVTIDAQKQLWVATTNGLWRRSAGAWVNMDETMMDPGNGRTYYRTSATKRGR
jgi:ligand-binding sensor domain-containing protein